MREKGMRWALPGIVFVSSFAMSAACGSEAPSIGSDNCPSEETPGTTVTTTVATTGAGGTTAASTSAATGTTTVVTATSTSSGMQPPQDPFVPPDASEVASRLHACHKLTYAQVGNFLRNRGVAIPPGNVSDVKTTQTMIFGMNQTLQTIFGGSGAACETAQTAANGTNDPLCGATETCFCNQDDKLGSDNRNCLDVGNNSPDAPDGYCVSKIATAGFLYFTGKDALGVPKLDSRLAEKEEHSTASAMRLMDLFIQSAPQIVANMGDPSKAPACTLNGKNKPMFDPKDGSCVEESVSCLLGMPATDDHMLLCNLVVQKANQADQTDLTKKRNIAVAALLSAAHSCQ
ncbi:MAG: hypothetical protein FJ096_08075 [Deltaproteobacteria bacterium]|nr:hypothetical protein [Deltaproteobacteria bacterium]